MKTPPTWCRWSALNSLIVDGKKRQDFCVLKSLNWHVMLTKDIPSHAQNTAFFPPLWMPPAKCCGWPQTAFELRLYEWGGCKRQKQLQAEKERGREGRIGGQKVWWWERERKPQRFLAPILLFNLNCCGSSAASGGEKGVRRDLRRRGIFECGCESGREHGAVNQLEIYAAASGRHVMWEDLSYAAYA